MNTFKITKNLEEQNLWFEECKKRQIYYIFITERDKYSKINWDSISLNLSNEKEVEVIHNPIEEKIEKIIDIFINHVEDIDTNKYPLISNYSGNSLVGEFDNIPKEIAPKLAEELSIYLNKLVKDYVKQQLK